MSNQAQRIFRIQQIVNMIEAAAKEGKSASEKKLIAECCIQFGAGERYVKEYISNLIETGRIMRNDGDLFTLELYKKFLNPELTKKKEEEINKDFKEAGI